MRPLVDIKKFDHLGGDQNGTTGVKTLNFRGQRIPWLYLDSSQGKALQKDIFTARDELMVKHSGMWIRDSMVCKAWYIIYKKTRLCRSFTWRNPPRSCTARNNWNNLMGTLFHTGILRIFNPFRDIKRWTSCSNAFSFFLYI